jgi:hypothetical protein
VRFSFYVEGIAMSDITTIEIVLARVLTEEGHMAVKIKIPDAYNAVEVLGLLEAAKLHIYNEMQEFH